MKLDSIGTLFSNAWQRYRERFSSIIPIFLAPLVLIGIGEFLITRQTLAAIALGSLINLLGAILSIVASVAMISSIGKETSFSESYQTGFKLFWAAIWIAFLTVAATFGGFVMLIIPGIILVIQLTLGMYVLVLEDKHGIEALAESREYIKGYWWAVFGRGLLFGVMIGAAMFILFLPSTLIFGPIVGGLVYGLIFLFVSPFGICYNYEIYDNLRRLKPNAAEDAAKTERGFLKVSMVVGILGWFAFMILIVAGTVFLPAVLIREHAAYPNGYDYPPPMMVETSTMSTGEGQGEMYISPTSGPVGTKVTITGTGAGFDATNTILMKGLVAARDVSVSTNSEGYSVLSFAVPASLAPNCDPDQACPDFLLSVTPGSYEVSVMNSQGTVDGGTFTVTGE